MSELPLTILNYWHVYKTLYHITLLEATPSSYCTTRFLTLVQQYSGHMNLYVVRNTNATSSILAWKFDFFVATYIWMIFNFCKSNFLYNVKNSSKQILNLSFGSMKIINELLEIASDFCMVIDNKYACKLYMKLISADAFCYRHFVHFYVYSCMAILSCSQSFWGPQTFCHIFFIQKYM
jgi:hypothetical protein